MIFACVVCLPLVLKNASKAALNSFHVLNFCLLVLASILFGGKLIHYLQYRFAIGFLPPSSVALFSPAFFQKSLSSISGLLSGFILIAIYCRCYRLPLLRTLDFLFPYAMLGYAVMRIFGCFMAGCCFGIPTDFPLAVTFPPATPAGQWFPGTKLHPVQLYYGISAIAIFFFLRIIDKRHLKDGDTALFGLMLYGFMNFMLAFFRGDYTLKITFLILDLRIGQFFHGLLFLFSSLTMTSRKIFERYNKAMPKS